MDFKLYGQPVTVTQSGKILSADDLVIFAVRTAIAGPPVGPEAGNGIIAKLIDSYGVENVTDIELDKDKEDKSVIY